MSLRIKNWMIGLIGVLAFFFAGCTTIGPVTTTGAVIESVGETFLQVGADYNRLCQPGVIPSIPAKECAAWKGFVPTYQLQHGTADQAHKAISQCLVDEAQVPTGRDCGSTAEVLSVINAIKSILGQYIVAIIIAAPAQEFTYTSMGAIPPQVAERKPNAAVYLHHMD